MPLQVTEELLWELFMQAGPITSVYMPKDKVTGIHQNYGFVEFRSEEVRAREPCRVARARIRASCKQQRASRMRTTR